MSVIIENSRPKILVLSSGGAVDSGTNATIVNGDESLMKSLEDSDVVMEEPPAQQPLPIDIPDDSTKKEELSNGIVRSELPQIISSDVEMENLSGASSEIPVPSRSSPEAELQIKELQAELLREETKLTLMKRIYQLQNQPVKQEKREESTGAERKGQHSKAAAAVVLQQNGIKANKNQPDGATGKSDKQFARDARKTQPVLKYQQNATTGPGYGGYSGPAAAVQNSRAQPAPPTPQPPPPAQKPQQHPIETLEQQFSNDRITLRRQMEKSIMQIVPPKPPLPDINFIPNTVCPDFVALLGMELAANYAINGKNLIDQSSYVEPHQCLKCGEDVCPLWKVDAENHPTVVCESCYYAARSTVSRTGHLDALKKSFADVLDKERDLERSHAAAMEKAKATAPPRTVNKPAPLVPTYPSNANVRSQVASTIVNNHHGGTNSNNSHHIVRSSPKQSSFYNQAAGLAPHHSQSAGLRPASSLPPAPPARNSSKPPISSPYAPMAMPIPFAPTSTSNRQQQHVLRQSADVQRQYLLDMISRAPKQQSAPAGGGRLEENLTWATPIGVMFWIC
ncbi:transcriptional repressor p66-beta-like [Paramacrobiotus metropolitanus]|uniref:transcriptional repressor p66-beta-like n=1 Tax=Paramacrobiotus metropolitanus TaxID=2943436 RepID=UPI0024459E65|nr:transcriptional repressor p66-beta-like [Paramacrobiotus metropolitanus]